MLPGHIVLPLYDPYARLRIDKLEVQRLSFHTIAFKIHLRHLNKWLKSILRILFIMLFWFRKDGILTV